MRVAVVWRGDGPNERLRPVIEELDATPVMYRDAIADEVREALRDMDAVLAWVDPIGGGEDRTHFDALLRDVARRGTWVSAHPDVIAVLGTKEVLYTTRDLAWGSDVALYRSRAELERGVRERLATGPRVLKPRYGNGGIGVWKVELVDDDRVRVHGAEVRDLVEEECELDRFLDRFAGEVCVIDQPFFPRVAEGLVRCYFVVDRVVGFAHQGAEPLLDNPGAAARVMGLPSPKTMFSVNHADFAGLRKMAEHELPAMVELLGLTLDQLPVLWDADFLRGEGDSFVLCEINCSCVTPFPPAAPAAIAEAVRARGQ
jgi:hypothetical protein